MVHNWLIIIALIGNFEIDMDELSTWLSEYPEVKELFGLTGPRGFFKKYKCAEDVGLRKKELMTLKRDMLEVLDDVDFYRKEEESMNRLKQQYELGLVPLPPGTSLKPIDLN